ncbi:MAG: 3-deoxy-D-manno-octulosonic acid transferase, partial [Gemmatimonadaceae bacterium]
MNPALAVAYEGAMLLARGAAALAPRGEGKLARTFHGRRGVRERYVAWGRRGRDARRPLLWMHAPSVGEGLQARPVLERLRSADPALQLAYTFFSPSAEPFARALDVDFRDYLPFDARGDARAALEALRPRALIFSKLDVWPNLSLEARSRGVRLGLISATLRPGSGRRSRMAAALLKDAYARLDLVGAVHDEDAELLVALGVRPQAIRVTGDARFDQVWGKAAQVNRDGALLAPLRSQRFTLVAGSTWPADERPLLEAWEAARLTHPEVRLVIAPHEPTPHHLEPIERRARAAGVSLARLGSPEAGGADVVLVDRVGVLGELYALADVAYVGGGFHDAGLHSVLEPAAYGVPVLFGPRHGNSRDASRLLQASGGVATSSAALLRDRLQAWIAAPDERRRAGVAA